MEKKRKREPKELGITRRDFIGLLGVGAAGLVVASCTSGTIRESGQAAGSKIRMGDPTDFPVGSARIFESRRAVVVRDEEGVFAMSLVCPHRRCTVTKTSRGFTCPCHGSEFNEEGKLSRGPARRGLTWYNVSVDDNGELVVDLANKVRLGTKYVL
jgi:Rieske Fe-S protein